LPTTALPIRSLLDAVVRTQITGVPLECIGVDEVLADTPLQDHIATMIQGDVVQYRNQNPEFVRDPVGEMRSAIDVLLYETERFERYYLEFVDELVFGERNHFVDARAVFVDVAEQLLARAGKLS